MQTKRQLISVAALVYLKVKTIPHLYCSRRYARVAH
jgi:hypothetical protein